jgi:hypothetical protein
VGPKPYGFKPHEKRILQDRLLELLIRDYVRQLKLPPPRHWDFRSWSDRILWYSHRQHQLYNHLRVLDKHHIGLVFIFVGKEAEQYVSLIDKTKHDVRDCAPWFFSDDAIDWRV